MSEYQDQDVSCWLDVAIMDKMGWFEARVYEELEPGTHSSHFARLGIFKVRVPAFKSLLYSRESSQWSYFTIMMPDAYCCPRCTEVG